MNKNEESLRDMWDNTKNFNICVIGEESGTTFLNCWKKGTASLEIKICFRNEGEIEKFVASRLP